MTKWFDTNYHYMVPEFTRGQTLHASPRSSRSTNIREAKALGYQTRPVLLGPVTYLKLGKSKDADARSAVAAAAVCCRSMSRCCAGSPPKAPNGCRSTSRAWCSISTTRPGRRCARPTARSPTRCRQLKIMLTTYFGGLGDNLDTALSLPVAGLHLDLVRAPRAARRRSLAKAPRGSGAVAGRDRRPQYLARRSAGAARSAGAGGRQARHGSCPDRAVLLAAACADRPRPGDRASIRTLKSWLAFAVQKMGELATLGQALAAGRDTVARCARVRRLPPLPRAGHRRRSTMPPSRRASRRSPQTWPIASSGFAARAETAAQALQSAGVPDHDHRLVPADRGGAKGPRRPCQGRAERRRLRDVPARGDRRARCAGRRRSASTCWCMASSSATTWCSISASSSPASPSPGMAGCSPTARAACGRRSSSATCRARSR